MELIDRYVYAVTRALPAKQREDIDKELRTLIDDMLEQYEGRGSYENNVRKVLIDLGDPAVLAENYRGTKHYLIGPQYYDKYIFILKTVIGAVFLGISVATVVGLFSSEGQKPIIILGNYAGTLFSAILQAFAWITIGFAVFERRGKALPDDEQGKGWDLADLPEVPHVKTVISPAEPIFSIIASAILLTILYIAPQLFAAYIPVNGESTVIIPIFNIASIKAFRLLIAGIFISGIIKDVLKLVYGRWTLKMAVPYAVAAIINGALALVVFANPVIWNHEFSAGLAKHIGYNPDLAHFWPILPKVLVLIIAAGCVADIVKAMYKGIRYNNM